MWSQPRPASAGAAIMQVPQKPIAEVPTQQHCQLCLPTHRTDLARQASWPSLNKCMEENSTTPTWPLNIRAAEKAVSHRLLEAGRVTAGQSHCCSDAQEIKTTRLNALKRFSTTGFNILNLKPPLHHAAFWLQQTALYHSWCFRHFPARAALQYSTRAALPQWQRWTAQLSQPPSHWHCINMHGSQCVFQCHRAASLQGTWCLTATQQFCFTP